VLLFTAVHSFDFIDKFYPQHKLLTATTLSTEDDSATERCFIEFKSVHSNMSVNLNRAV